MHSHKRPYYLIVLAQKGLLWIYVYECVQWNRIHCWLFDGRRSFDRYLLLFLTHPISMHLFGFVLKVSKAYSYTLLFAICFSFVCRFPIKQISILSNKSTNSALPVKWIIRLFSSVDFLSLFFNLLLLFSLSLFLFVFYILSLYVLFPSLICSFEKSLFAIVYSGLLSGWSIQTNRGFCWSISSATWRSQHKTPQ